MRSKNKDFVGLELSHELLEQLKAKASQKELSISAFIRMVLIDYLDQKNDTPRTQN